MPRQSLPATEKISVQCPEILAEKCSVCGYHRGAISGLHICMESEIQIEPLEPRTLLASPIVITAGGTYRGSWTSTNAKVPAVTIKTSQPVLLDGCTMRGPGNLIATAVDHVKLTVKNCWGYGTVPGTAGLSNGRFLAADMFDNIDVEQNHIENTRGIHLLNYAGNRTSSQTIKINHNWAHDIDGRRSDGHGGHLTFNIRVSRKDGHTEQGWDDAQFIQLDKVRRVPGIEIGNNQVINDPGRSRVEDNINIYLSSGTAASPIRIHDNFIRGAYTIKPWQGTHTDANWKWDWGYSGGGILLGDGKNSNPADDSAYVKAYSNTVVSTTNYGIAIAAGHDLEAYGNRIVSCGSLGEYGAIAQQNVGLYIWDSYKAGIARFYNNTAHDNVIGWVRGTGRNDWWVPNAKTFLNNKHWAAPITLATEAAEYKAWLS